MKTRAGAAVEPGWYGLKGAAAYLGMSRATLKRLVRRGRLRGYRPAGLRCRRYRREDLDALLTGA
jgi:excisionase family DNA binding protein